MNTVDIIFCSLPPSEIEMPYGAPAILKGVVKAEGYTAKTKDFAMSLFNLCNKDPDLFNTVQGYFLTSKNSLGKKEQIILDKFYNNVIQYFKNNPSRYIGISVFSMLTHKSTFEIISRIKKENLPVQIVIGGRGAKTSPYSAIAEILNLKSIEKIQYFGEVLKNRGLINHLVIGDGEDAILDVLKNNKTKEIYSADTFEYPTPDYEDYDLHSYLWKNDTISFPITGSRGCVRRCDFCDIEYHFGKYKYRKGKDIANEMLKINKKYGFNKFNFTDSLVNGGLKPLEEFCEIIADHNKKNSDNKITWSGQYVCRESKFMPERLYKLMAESGVEGLVIGAESGSDHVLEHMVKKTSNTALLEELEMFRKYGITSELLMFTGHWAEEEEHFIEHCQMLYKMLPFVRSGTISMVSLGILAQIGDGTPSMKEVHEGKIIRSDFDKEYIWLAKYNPKNTFKERVRRRILISKLCRFLEYPMDREMIFLSEISTLVEQNYEKINEFYRTKLSEL